MDDQAQMVFNIANRVNGLFDNEEEGATYDLRTIDATQFFTAYVKAGTYLFNSFTGQDKNNLEFTHLANQLIVQDLLDKED